MGFPLTVEILFPVTPGFHLISQHSNQIQLFEVVWHPVAEIFFSNVGNPVLNCNWPGLGHMPILEPNPVTKDSKLTSLGHMFMPESLWLNSAGSVVS